MTTKTPYVIDTDHPTNGPWRETPFGHKYASVTLADGRKLHLSLEKDKRVRIPYKPRGANWGWTYVGTVRENGKILRADKVAGSLGVRGLLIMAGVIEGPEQTRVREVNEALAARGVAERLEAEAHGYFYFRGGTASRWPQTAVYVYRATALTVEAWLAEYDRLKGAR